MFARNILLLLIALCAATSKHVHSNSHKNHVEQISIVYVATVATGYPISSSSDRNHLATASRGVIN